MRMRLGLLQDPAVIERQIRREAQEAEEKRLRSQHRPSPGTPTVRTAEEMQADTEAREREKRFIEGKVKNDEKRKEKRLIRPLSEAKAIDSGANFISEAFIFGVGLSLLLFENFRSRRKENNRRDTVKERLDKLEDDIMRTQQEKEILQGELADLRGRMQVLPFTLSSSPPPSQSRMPAMKSASAELGGNEDTRNRAAPGDSTAISTPACEASPLAELPTTDFKRVAPLPEAPQQEDQHIRPRRATTTTKTPSQ